MPKQVTQVSKGLITIPFCGVIGAEFLYRSDAIPGAQTKTSKNQKVISHNRRKI